MPYGVEPAWHGMLVSSDDAGIWAAAVNRDGLAGDVTGRIGNYECDNTSHILGSAYPAEG